jgi:hypothetical protein
LGSLLDLGQFSFENTHLVGSTSCLGCNRDHQGLIEADPAFKIFESNLALLLLLQSLATPQQLELYCQYQPSS